MKQSSISLFLAFAVFLFTGNPPVQAQGATNKAEKIKNLLDRCDSIKNNFMLAARDHGLALRELGFSGLQLTPADDAADRSQFFYYIASGFVFQEPTNVDTVTFHFSKSLEEAKKAKSAKLIANAAISLMHIGFEMQNSRQTDTYKNIIQAIIDTTTNQAILQNGYAALGTYYQQKSFYATAQDYFLKSIMLQQKQPPAKWRTKDKADFANRCYTLAKLYMNTGTFDKAFATLHTGQSLGSLDYLVDMRYKILLIDAFSKTGNIDSALYYLHTYVDPVAAKYEGRQTIPDFIILCNLSVSRYYLDHQEYQKAWPYLQKLQAYPASKLQPFESYQLQKTTGLYYEQTGNFLKALPLFMQALPVAEQLSKEDYTDILKYIAIAQQGMGNLSQALQFYGKYNENLDSLTKEKLSRNFADQQTRYETAQKEQQIVSLDKENKLSELQLQNAARTKWFLVIGLIVSGIIALLFYFVYRNREKLNKQLNLQKAALQTVNDQLSVANDTKAKLFGIISHDLRAPVSKIAQLMQLQKEHPEMLDEQVAQKHEANLKQSTESLLETMEDLLLWSKSQMQQFTLHERQVNISHVVVKEIDFLRAAIDEKQITIRNQLPPDFLQTTDEDFLAVIIRNLLQNAIKYSNADTTISITATQNQLCITNTSLGTSADMLNAILQNKQISSKSSGLGLQLISDLATQLGLQVFFEKQNEQQLTAVVRFKS